MMFMAAIGICLNVLRQSKAPQKAEKTFLKRLGKA